MKLKLYWHRYENFNVNIIIKKFLFYTNANINLHLYFIFVDIFAYCKICIFFYKQYTGICYIF